MYKIQKGKESMTAKERVKRTFQYEKTDRVTIGYDANPAVHERLKRLWALTDAMTKPFSRY